MPLLKVRTINDAELKNFSGGGIVSSVGEWVGNSIHNSAINRAQHLIDHPRRRGLPRR